jgi:hypothetical protein
MHAESLFIASFAFFQMFSAFGVAYFMSVPQPARCGHYRRCHHHCHHHCHHRCHYHRRHPPAVATAAITADSLSRRPLTSATTCKYSCLIRSYQTVLYMPFFPFLNLTGIYIVLGIGADDGRSRVNQPIIQPNNQPNNQPQTRPTARHGFSSAKVHLTMPPTHRHAPLRTAVHHRAPLRITTHQRAPRRTTSLRPNGVLEAVREQ